MPGPDSASREADSGSNLSVSLLGEEHFAEWTELLRESLDGSIYQTPEYLDALCAAAGGRFRIVGVRKGSALRGGVALYERRTATGHIVAPRLLLYYNGPVLARYESRYPSRNSSRAVSTLSALLRWIGRAGYDRVTWKTRSSLTDVRPFLNQSWSALPSYTYVVPLGDTAETWDRIEQNLRRLVKRAEGSGVTVTEDDDFDAFHDLHVATMDRKDRETYLPPEAFRRYFGLLRDRGLASLFQARLHDGRVVASSLVLTGGFPIAHTVCAAADEEHLSLGVNAFLRWKTFEALTMKGYSGNDLTDAALNSVTRFKSQLGGNLELLMELDAPMTRAYRARAFAQRARTRARGLAGKVLRTALGRR